jgi:nitroreductase
MKLADYLMDWRNVTQFQDHPVARELVLEVLNDAVWAPNHGLREPWRFVYVDQEGMQAMRQLQQPSPAHLLIIAKEDEDPHRRDEDLAAVCCLVANFELLAREKRLGTRRSMPEWIYDPELRKRFGIRPNEWIAVVLDLGHIDPAADGTPAAADRISLELL